MSAPNSNPRVVKPSTLGITARTALLSWLVTLITLLVFSAAIIPQQKRTFEGNLESKARGIAVSLRDVAAGAVVNEDFSTVVDHCKEMLKGDPAIDHLVITKNDGFSLVSDRGGWRAADDIGSEWRPEKREASGGIGTVRLFNRRVFHYSQPFDYSGIEWGWIHVGLSLKSYDANVGTVYKRTGLLAVACMLLSLVASGIYAKRLLRPVIQLRNVVQRVASGDLTMRASTDRRDELGTLAGSVNVMTEALLRRDRILQCVRFAAEEFLSAEDWRSTISGILTKMGSAAEVSRIRLFENHRAANDQGYAEVRHQWAREGTPQTPPEADGVVVRVRSGDHPQWREALRRGDSIAIRCSDMDERQRQLLALHQFKSILLMPVMVERELWGFLSLADCEVERDWSEADRDSLRAVADMLGAAIAQQRTRQALIEAKETLEVRVKERTQELELQVQAKDKAHAELTEAQHKLMDASRRAGMAEVATGVLHNVGNVLNSVNVSAHLVHERLGQLRAEQLGKLSAMIELQRPRLGEFLTSDPKGKLIPDFITSFSGHLLNTRNNLRTELEVLCKHVEHIKQTVAMQQSYARVAGVLEDLSAANLVEDALLVHAGAFARDSVRIVREFQEVSLVRVDKHKVLQILINLFANAKHAMKSARSEEKVLKVTIGSTESGMVRIAVRDNGVGIPPENLTRIFQHGFTTKRDGHGFGLHSGACAARELGGNLTVTSEGTGKGATFILELPEANKDATEQTQRN